MFVQCMNSIVYSLTTVRCTLFPPVTEICARLACNICQYMTTVSCWANSLVWVAVCYFTASQQSGGGRGSVATQSPQCYTALHYLARVTRAGRGDAFPPLVVAPNIFFPPPYARFLGIRQYRSYFVIFFTRNLFSMTTHSFQIIDGNNNRFVLQLQYCAWRISSALPVQYIK